ncbi:MAG: FeoB-associated Cys-rich membrane protein [Lachnospiraceae bacterium]|jgi:hypothetical protein|nr:FeoB-associated Cys-rich membrane protein [Lachnospiraceae bacterium]MEE3461970.1 FeoB-associated Cys-rich membrane protein [Lachnospiraceae bacterium]
MINVILIVILAAIAFLCIRYIYKTHKSGNCVGCSLDCGENCTHYGEKLNLSDKPRLSDLFR